MMCPICDAFIDDDDVWCPECDAFLDEEFLDDGCESYQVDEYNE